MKSPRWITVRTSKGGHVRKLLLGVVLGIALVIGGAFAFVITGQMPVNARGKPLPFERLVARVAIQKAIGDEDGRPAPIPADEANLLAGAKVFQVNCAVCHGLPGQAKPSAIATGLFPRAPQLWPPKGGVTDDPVGETFWKAKNGIRLTGMPGFADSLSETELWQVSLLLLKAEKLPPAVMAALK